MKISSWVKDVIANEGFAIGDITYVFCSPEYHICVNRSYLGHDYHTDVITFDYGEQADGDLAKSDYNSGMEAHGARGGRRRISGDILIDQATVAEYSREWGTTPDDELMRVMIHGVLHLCGHSDGTDEERAAMRAREDACLKMYHDAYGSYPTHY